MRLHCISDIHSPRLRCYIILGPRDPATLTPSIAQLLGWENHRLYFWELRPLNKPFGVFNVGVLFVPLVWVLDGLFELPLGVPFVWPVADPLVDPSGAVPAVQQN